MKIFISHRSKDNYVVKKITDTFDKYYIKYWVDNEEIEYPDNIRGKISEGLKNATHFLLVWSKNAEESKEIKKEIDTVNSSDYVHHVKKFSFRLDDTPLPYGFASNTHVQINKKNVEEKTRIHIQIQRIFRLPSKEL